MIDRTPSRPLLRYHGGKWRIAPWIFSQFPPHQIYCEPFGGGGSVLLRKPRSAEEVYNDLDGEVVNLFRVARDRGGELVQAIELTPYSREEFNSSFTPTKNAVERARRTLLRSFGGFGGNLTRPNRDATPQRTGFRASTANGHNGQGYAGEWRDFPQALRRIIDRLRGVIIENRPACEVMLAHDSPATLHYVDPPYVHSTRGFDCGGTHRGYRFEMSDAEHRELAAVLNALRGG